MTVPFDITIGDIEDLEMRDKVIQLRNSQPHRPLLVLKIALEQVHGDCDEALALLLYRWNDAGILAQVNIDSYLQ